jgi:hypothetical protein
MDIMEIEFGDMLIEIVQNRFQGQNFVNLVVLFLES